MWCVHVVQRTSLRFGILYVLGAEDLIVYSRDFLIPSCISPIDFQLVSIRMVPSAYVGIFKIDDLQGGLHFKKKNQTLG